MQIPHGTLARYIKYFLGLFEVLLAGRVILKFLAANPKAPVVDALYRITDSVVMPFSGIFSNSRISGGGIIDFVAISAMIGYPIIVYIALELINLVSRKAETY